MWLRKKSNEIKNASVFTTLLLLAVVATLLLALVAAVTTPGCRLVALGEDHIAPQASLATCGGAAGSDLAFLDGSAAGS